MKQRNKFWNNILGWLVFAISTIIYFFTLEPTLSFWDSGEFIATAFKLEVGHPPGAPLYLMFAKLFSLFASNNQEVAFYTNFLSAVTSGATVMFLFWTITRIVFKIFDSSSITSIKPSVVFFAGLIGSLSFAFTDSFWYSAVETEVYSTSILFTAITFWVILKWDEVADCNYSNRWIVLVSYLVGLSIGIHLLNLLVIPAITVFVYFRKYNRSVKGFLAALFFGFVLLFVIQNILIIGLIKLAGVFELFFVNMLHFQFYTGFLVYIFLLVLFLICGIWVTQKYRYYITNTVFIAVSFLLIGYSSYTLIAIRAKTNTPINEGNPSDIFSFINYLSREQYGDRPLFYGQNYNAAIVETLKGEPIYIKQNNRYVVSYYQDKYVYDSKNCVVFPRMYSNNTNHVDVYKSWGNVNGESPTFFENVQFFLNYQVYYMYIRYFLWNFVGKQNDIDSNGGILKGNFCSGIPLIDNYIFGSAEKLPDFYKKNKGRNYYFLLPFVLGMIGLLYMAKKHMKSFVVVMLLFLMTGLAIVVYLNQTPLQPRERDYSYIGSFYAFSIWIGYGVVVLHGWLKKWGILIACSVPTVLIAQNWNDHNRSNRYLARSFAMNYLNSCAPNAILFTNGDNDTFPLWYLQEVEGVRTDVRVVNTMLLNSEWYIDQMKHRIYLSDTLPISFSKNEYIDGKRNYVYFVNRINNPITLKNAIEYIRSEKIEDKIEIESGEILDIIPSKQLLLPINSNDSAFECIPITINRSYISKSQVIIIDILANNNWKRPIYFTSPTGDETFGLSEYLRLEGFAYRLTQKKSVRNGRFDFGSIDTDKMYAKLMERFDWENMNRSDVYVDDINRRMASIMRIRVNFARLALQLHYEKKYDSAQRVIQKCMDLMPCSLYPHDTYTLELMETAKKIGATKQLNQLKTEYAVQNSQMIKYIRSLPNYLSHLLMYEEIVASNAQKQIIRIVSSK